MMNDHPASASHSASRGNGSGRYLKVGLLAAAVLLSALAVVYAKYESRKLFVELQTLQKIRDDMAIEWGQLQLEESTWATHVRIEGAARSKLGMTLPPPDAVVIVQP
ncbi:MAG: cell division protein FtsL [Pseudomonadota bacterium]